MRFAAALLIPLAPLVFGANCEALAGLALPDAAITLAAAVPAGPFTQPSGRKIDNLPAFCEVHGILRPTGSSTVHFEVWMPVSGWNGRFEGVGNGGLAGTISFPAMAAALRRGYAAASTDTGHTAQEPRDWLENRERLIDYSYRGLHLTAVAAKSIVAAYYSQPAKYSYYLGCSTGGKQGLMEAQRFPADYDGIVAGNAANFWTHQMAGELWNGIATGTPETNLPPEKLQLVQDAAMASCDALDGLKDGIIADPLRCHFDPKKLLCKGPEGANCLTASQVGAVEKIYGGIVNPRTGEKLYPGLFPGGELGWGKAGGQMVINRTATSGVSSFDFWRYAFFQKTDWQFRTFDFDRDLKAADEKLGPVTNATDPNLDEFRRLGHKLIYYHGAADPLIPARNGIDYFESVVKKQRGLERTQQFFRVFLVPGMYHCAGGPGATTFDMIDSASQWVEQGSAPQRIVATKYDGERVAFQRPLCAYPLVARYKGSGGVNDASSFTCAK